MKSVLDIIKPSKEEERRFSSYTAEFLCKLNTKLTGAKAILGGSGAKGTWLSGSHDVDIFVLFDYQDFVNKSDQLSGFLETVLKKAFPHADLHRVHGSRDYFQLPYGGLRFEVVPILKISKAEQARNITDISPLHSKWVNQHAQKVKDDIRLLKQFCKANNLYGAESYIGGFSGYVLEILAAHYGSFEKVLKAAQKWKEKEVVDPSKFYAGKEAALFHINTSKLQSPIVVVDPVDKNRNAAAALSMETFLLFKELAKKYLHKPGDKFFEKEEISSPYLRKKYKATILYLSVMPLEGKEDVVGVKLLKTFQFLGQKLKEFGVQKYGWGWDKKNEAVMYFIVKKKELPEYETRMGPPLKMKEYVQDFKKKYPNSFEEKGRIKAKVKVEHTKLKEFVNAVLKDEYVRERVKEVKKVEVA